MDASLCAIRAFWATGSGNSRADVFRKSFVYLKSRPPTGPDAPDNWGVSYNRVLKTWAQPFILQFCDRRIVHRSNALLGGAYGDTLALVRHPFQ